MAITAETLTLAALLIAPGVIAVLIGITLGVVEQKIDRDRLYLTSFVSSIFIDVVFIWVVQITGTSITGRTAIENVFFGEQRFHVEAAALLFILSCILGIVYAVALSVNIAHLCREALANLTSHQRNPWQPWVGGLRNAGIVQATLRDETEVVGQLQEYSRAEKERQIVLHKPQFNFEDKPNRDKLILTEDEISHLQVLTTRSREGPFTKLVKQVKAIYSWVGNLRSSQDKKNPEME